MRTGISTKITRPDRRRLEAITKDRQASLKAHIATLIERGEYNTDKLTVDGLVYLRGLSPNKKRPVRRRA